jgi:hypothetical protein
MPRIISIIMFYFECLLSKRLINELEVTMLDNIILQISNNKFFVSREKRRYKNKAAKIILPVLSKSQPLLSQYTTQIN